MVGFYNWPGRTVILLIEVRVPVNAASDISEEAGRNPNRDPLRSNEETKTKTQRRPRQERKIEWLTSNS